MNKQDSEKQERIVDSFAQSGEKSTAIGNASNFNIINVTQSTDEESLTSAIADIEALRNKVRLYEELGIINCTEELKGTQLDPLQCMPAVHNSLSFMGVAGEKWVRDEQLRKTFENMLRQTKTMRGEVRFLLINPAGEAYNRLYQLRGESVPYDSYPRFLELTKKFDNLKVRLYSDMPSFRMQFVDDSYLAISRYYFDKVSHDNSGGGWKTPHLIISNEQRIYGRNEIKHRGSLYGSFLLSYNFIWSHSEDIQDWAANGKKFNK